ncbi:MAG: 50S ribosomal protein L25 [Sedimentisphaerales bacterium]|nr:50S ribosomal protein L25 [Sedimentisphaerales bacterium]
MAKTVSLEGQIRERIGSKAASAIRRQGRIPAVVYGHQEEPLVISLDAHDFTEGLHHGMRLMDLTVAGKSEKAIIKDVQYDHLGREVIHADLMRVDVTEVITVVVPVELKGTPKGAQEGGVLTAHTNRLEVECLAVNIPEVLVVPVKDLGVGESIHAGQVQLPEGVTLASSAEMLIASCSVLQEVKTTEEVEAEVPAVPEVIGAEKQPEEGAEAEAPAKEKEKEK